VLGGLLGYAIGYYAYEAVGLPILKFYGKEHALDTFIQFVHEYGVPAIIIKGATPIPFKVVTIAAGVAKMDLAAFIGASIVARAMRFYLVAGLLYFFGQPIKEFIEKRLTLVTTVFVVVLVSGFVAVKYLF
jgi:membrane protein YqaA with SNARE-associated domain